MAGQPGIQKLVAHLGAVSEYELEVIPTRKNNTGDTREQKRVY